MRLTLFILTLATLACSPQRPLVAPFIPSGPSAAALAVTSFAVTQPVSSAADGYVYDVTLRLADTAGRGAWVTGIVLVVSGAGTTSYSMRSRVNPGEPSWLPPPSCCHIGSPTAVSTVLLTVHFADDDGRPGRVESSASATIVK